MIYCNEHNKMEFYFWKKTYKRFLTVSVVNNITPFIVTCQAKITSEILNILQKG